MIFFENECGGSSLQSCMMSIEHRVDWNNFIIIIIEFIMVQIERKNRWKYQKRKTNTAVVLWQRQQQQRQINAIHTLEMNATIHSMICSERFNSMGFILHGWLQCENSNRNGFCWCFCCYRCCCCYCITEEKPSRNCRLAKFVGLFTLRFCFGYI